MTRGLFFLGRSFLSGGLLSGGFFGRELLFGGGGLGGDFVGELIERFGEVFFELSQSDGKAVGAFADLFESGSAFVAQGGFSLGEPLAEQLASGVGLGGGFVEGFFKLVNELAGFVELDLHGERCFVVAAC